jgi:hypothetical protein
VGITLFGKQIYLIYLLIYLLFLIYLVMSLARITKRRMDGRQMNDKLEGRGHGLIEVLSQHLPGG